MFLRKRLGGVARTVLIAAVMLGVLAIFVGLTRMAGGSASSQGQAIAQQSVRRAAVQCYALEGSYPPSYQYLKDNNYGTHVDEELYFVDYQFLAGNLMPDITVLVRTIEMAEVSEQ